MINSETFNSLIKNIDGLESVIKALNKNNIKYGLFAGAYVSLITSNRVPTDVDLLIADDDFSKVEKLFKAKIVNKVFGLFIYPLKHEGVELSSYLTPLVGLKKYSFRLTDLAWKNTTKENIGNLEINMCNPADTILLKAILQRGQTEGKHDTDDIDSLIKVVPVDIDYLQKRLIESKADERVFSVLKSRKLVK